MSHHTGSVPDTEPAGQWLKQAACAGRQDEMFPDNNEAGIAAAKSICQPCTVRVDCVLDALRTGDNHWGIRGGLTSRQRHTQYKGELRRQRAAA